jgi:hypothetical protein
VDAWEYSYPYKERSQFEEAYTTVREKSVEWTAQPEKYRRHVEAGFGIWMDCRWRQVGWNLDDFSKNHFTPAEFETTVRLALDVSDEYVWIYTEQPRWWTNERLPAEYVAALKQARRSDGETKSRDFSNVKCEGTYRHHLQGICTNDRDAIYLLWGKIKETQKEQNYPTHSRLRCAILRRGLRPKKASFVSSSPLVISASPSPDFRIFQ